MRYLFTACVMVGLPVVAYAQTLPIERYNERFYAAGAAQPTQTNPIEAATVTCNLAPWTGTNVNPTTLTWADPANAGKICQVNRATALAALPIGQNYEGTLSAVTAAGESAESNRAPFVRAALPSAPANVAYLKPSGT